MARPGLTKKIVTVRGKKGPIKRTYWVRAGAVAKKVGRFALNQTVFGNHDEPKKKAVASQSRPGFIARHKGKLAAAAVAAGAGVMLHRKLNSLVSKNGGSAHAPFSASSVASGFRHAAAGFNKARGGGGGASTPTTRSSIAAGLRHAGAAFNKFRRGQK